MNKEKGFNPPPKMNMWQFFRVGFFGKKNIVSDHKAGSSFLVGGFTLIEVMISIGLFTVIMVVGITAILGVNNTHRKTRTMRAAIDNLSFIMEDMSRNIRLGYDYRCVTDPSDLNPTEIEEPSDGEYCQGIAFEPFWGTSTDTDQVVYLIDQGTESIFKALDGSGATLDPMNSTEVKIDATRSGFTIYGTGADDGEQPSVLIRLNGSVTSSGQTTEFNLQTTVSQRRFDAIAQ